MVTDRETLHLSREEQKKRRLHPKYHTLEYYLRVGTLQRKERERRGTDNPQRSVYTSVVYSIMSYMFKSSPFKRSMCTSVLLLIGPSPYCLLFCMRNQPHLPVTPEQLMRPGIGQNTTYTMGNFVKHLNMVLLPIQYHEQPGK